MRRLAALLFILGLSVAQSIAQPDSAPVRTEPYYWVRTPASNSAELVTLFCHSCASDSDTPLVAVLRDTMGDSDPANDRLVFVWLLDYSPLNWHQRALAGVPFFYWQIGKGSNKPENGDVRPLINVAAPLHPVLSTAARQLLQWTVFDPMITEVRASTRAYGENETDHERIRLEETISYLSKAPAGDGASGISSRDLDFLVARLSLRKRMLGGLVGDKRAADVGIAERVEAESLREKNWEYLRESAERVGLVFESFRLSGSDENYALVLFRPGSVPPPPSGEDDGPAWRILNIANPWKDRRVAEWHELTLRRQIDGQDEQLIPLAAYSLTYPRRPLLMVDFRDKQRIRQRVVLQRTVDQFVTGVLGLSHFTNWYYFAGADTYTFVAGRRGAALNRTARLDSYAQFRSALALDTELPSDLRSALQSRVNGLGVNPLDASPETEVATARARYAHLLDEASDGRLAHLLQLERREEVADFGRGGGHIAWDETLHVVSFGMYTHRAAAGPELLSRLDTDRRIESNLSMLDKVAKQPSPPEVQYDSKQISAAVTEVSELLPLVHSSRVRARAISDLRRIQSTTENDSLRADCDTAIHAVHAGAFTGVAAEPRAITALDGRK